jgi:hypothetical protein
MTRIFFFLSIGIGSLALAYGWTQTRYPAMSLAPLLLATLWLVSVKWKLAWASAFGFALLTVLSAFGLAAGFSFFYALTGILGGLAAWDLEHFSRRLEAAAMEADRAALELGHLFQLAVILLVSVGASYLALAARIRMQFGLAVGMVLMTIGGLAALVYWLRKKED